MPPILNDVSKEVKITLIISCGTVCYMHHSLERALEGIARAGFEYVELLSIPKWIAAEHIKPEMNETDLRKIEKVMNKYGLSAMSLSGHIDFLVKTPHDTRIAIEALERRIELAHRMGCKYVNTGAWTTEKQSFYDTVDELVDQCKRYGVVLGLEVGEPGLTATGKQLMGLFKHVKSENIGINYDTGNIRWLVGIEPEKDLPSTLERLVHMHVKDQVGGKGKEDFPALGDGEVNFTKVFDILHNSTFKGPFTVEIENPRENPVQRDDEAKRSHDFIRKYVQ